MKPKLKEYKSVKEFGKALGLSDADMANARQKRRRENLKSKKLKSKKLVKK